MPRAAKVKSITSKLSPEQKHHYDNLMAARDAVMGRVRSYAEDALDCSNADNRVLTAEKAIRPRFSRGNGEGNEIERLSLPPPRISEK